jgi:TonB-linked SusC/RagA family outer membrane protein
MKRHLLLPILMLLMSATVGFAQQTLSGTVTDPSGEALIGASILIKGTSTGTVTDLDGSFSINVSSDDVLVVSYTGYETKEVPVNNQTSIAITLAESSETLSEVVVTGYSSERKADIVGSVGVVNTEDALTTPSANVAQQLQGRAAGVTVSGDGAPGEGAKVRIRGFTSFGNSNPLYIIDGVPTKDPGSVNPSDIASMQVLKDATAASIYGARAAQGVIIITTKGGKAGKINVSYDGFYGATQVPERSFLDVVNTEQYLDYLQRSRPSSFIHPVFGSMSNPSIPDRIVTSPGFRGGVSANDPRADLALYDISNFSAPYQIMETSPGTNWFDEISQNGPIQQHQVNVSGGNESATYSASFNFFDQEGAIKFTDYRRYALRLNTSFKATDWLTIGENLQVIQERNRGNRTRGEGGAWGWAYRYVPYIPVYDLGGGFGGNAVGESGNADNPIAFLTRTADNSSTQWRLFGNTFAEIQPIEGLSIRSSFGADFSNFYNANYTYKTYENSENTGITAYGTNNNNNLTWTWTNTATYETNINDIHSLKFLAGTEAIKFQGYGFGVSTNTFDFEDPNFINLNTDQFPTPNAYAYAPTEERLFSVFGRIDYQLNNKYIFNATVRRDGTSKIAQDVRFGTFPAFGLGWRLSEESFMQGLDWLDDLKLRGGWGQMGSIDNVSANNQFTTFTGNVGSSFYDITRAQTGASVGYRPQRIGSLTTLWEISETTNFGLDASMLNGKWNLAVDIYQNNTNDLLVNRIPTGAEPVLQQPAINLGQMVNKGIDIALGHRNNVGDFRYDLNLIFSRYTNEVTNIDGNPETFFSTGGNRINDIIRTQAGRPISSFWGYEIDPNDRFFDTQAEIDALSQDGAVLGSWKYVDQNGDGVINSDDQTWLGSPHPDFVASFNIDLAYKNFDFNLFMVWNQGNELFNNVAYFTDMQVFVGAVSTRVVNQDWRPGADNSSATHPRLAPGAESGYTPFTRSTSNSFYVEDGSFLRGRTAQLGYNFSPDLLQRAGISKARVYVQAQNFFTITNYSGSDPDINIQGGDLGMGIDQGRFPTLAQYLFGVQFSL